MRWKNTSLIGGTCTDREVLSESVLKHEGLTAVQQFEVANLSYLVFSVPARAKEILDIGIIGICWWADGSTLPNS